MDPRVDLVLLGEGSAVDWPLGRSFRVSAPTPRAVYALLEQELGRTDAEAWLFWDAALGPPAPERVESVLGQPGEAWHGGLRLGTAGLPGAVDFVHPTWMLNRDPDPRHAATSWRLSLGACLVRTPVLRQMRGPHPAFRSLDAAALEMGYRYIRRGVLVRHVPDLVPPGARARAVELSAEDELRFARYCFGRRWARWALLRMLMTGYRPGPELLRAWRRLATEQPPRLPKPFRRGQAAPAVADGAAISVLIPTIDRYPYLRVLLAQLREQTVRPRQIVIVDQTPESRRDPSLSRDFPELPLRLLYRDAAGQCSSRNAGLQATRGEYVLLADDDIEIGPTFLEQLLGTLQATGADVVSGIAHEVGADPMPERDRFIRASDVFPAGITLLKRSWLEKAGLFDLAYERGARADGDLGTRIYLKGALMVLDPSAEVLHHRAPRGGLRGHRVRTVTYASSRSRITHRNLPTASEIYLARRYGTVRQLRETVWIRLAGTFSVRGNRLRKVLKLLVSAMLLPDSLWKLRQRFRQAGRMREEFPQIPLLGPVSDAARQEAGPEAAAAGRAVR